MNKIDFAARAAEDRARTIEDYRAALSGAGPKLKELILDRAAQDRAISLFDLRELVRCAYPDGA